VLSLERMNRDPRGRPAARTLRCEPGVTLQAVHEAAAAHGLLYPVDYASKGSAHIGGSLATNAGGVKVLRYGLTRDWVLGLRAVVASGACLDLGGALVKNNTGYDLRQLFIGAEGTLGVIVEVTLRLCRPPADTRVALCAVPTTPRCSPCSPACAPATSRCRPSSASTTAACATCSHHRGGASPFAEASPRYVLIEVEVPVAGAPRPRDARPTSSECLGDAPEAGEIDDALLAGTPAQARGLWALREDISESLHRHTPAQDGHRPAGRAGRRVPGRPGAPPSPRACRASRRCASATSATATCTSTCCAPRTSSCPRSSRACTPSTTRPTRSCRPTAAASRPSTASACSSASTSTTAAAPEELAIFRGIKAALDPQGLFNPGKIF
jgi:FAD/FMN-containing dehydrogenase